MRVYVISLWIQCFYQQLISKLAMLRHQSKLHEINKLIVRKLGLILGLSSAGVIGGYLLGIPVLSLIYGVDLKDYKTALVILLLGGGALAFVNFLQMIITIARKQNLLNIGYVLGFLVFVLFGKLIVKAYGIVGISIFYTFVVLGIGITFGIITVLIIKRKSKEK